jgi:magnesium chelatase subunit I
MSHARRPTTLAELQAAGWRSRPVKDEVRENFLRKLQAGEELFPGIVGYDDTVIPEIAISLIAGHDMLFLGEKGQAKSRLMRLLVRFLDEAIPYLDDPAIPLHDDPLAGSSRPAPPRRSRSPGGLAPSGMPSGWRRAPSSPTSSARSIRPSWPAARAWPARRRSTSG